MVLLDTGFAKILVRVAMGAFSRVVVLGLLMWNAVK
jgi:hypothetical protein